MELTTTVVGDQTPVKEVEVKSFGAEVKDQKAEEPKVEVKAETPTEVKEEPKVEDKDQQRFAALTKKERILHRDRTQMKAFAQEIKGAWDEAQAFQQLKAQALKDPFKALEALGVTYEQLTDYKLNNNRPTPSLEVLEVKQEIQELRDQQKKEREEALKAAKQREQMEVKQTLAEWDQEVQDYIKTNSEKYELVSTFNESGLVKALIEEKFRTTKQILSLENACELAEKYLEELANKATATKKFKAKVVPQPKEEFKSSPSPQSRTLDNSMTTSTATYLHPRTEQDRMARAMAALDKK